MASSNTFLAGGIGQVGAGGGGRFPLLDRLLDLLLNVFEIDVEIREDRGGHALALADQAEQDVLGPDVLVVQTGGFFPRHLQDFPHPIRKVVAVHLPARLSSTPRPAASERSSHAPRAAPDRWVAVLRAPPGARAACESAAC